MLDPARLITLAKGCPLLPGACQGPSHCRLSLPLGLLESFLVSGWNMLSLPPWNSAHPRSLSDHFPSHTQVLCSERPSRTTSLGRTNADLTATLGIFTRQLCKLNLFLFIGWIFSLSYQTMRPLRAGSYLSSSLQYLQCLAEHLPHTAKDSRKHCLLTD